MIVAAIPAFDEEATIARVVIGSGRHVDKVLVCDDGSTDMTGEIAEKLGAEVVRHERNLGKALRLDRSSILRRGLEPMLLLRLMLMVSMTPRRSLSLLSRS